MLDFEFEAATRVHEETRTGRGKNEFKEIWIEKLQ